MEVLSDCIAAKRFLVPFWKRNLVNREVIADQVFMQPSDFLESDLSPEIKAMDLEDHLPISALIALRQIAAQEAVIEIKRLRASPPEMKRYVEEHHLDPEKEGGEHGKGKFWGIGKIAKLGKKNEFDDFIPGEKKKKGILKLLFKKHKKKTADGEGDGLEPEAPAEMGSPTLSVNTKKSPSGGVGGSESAAAVSEASERTIKKFSLKNAFSQRKPRALSVGDDTDGEGEMSEGEALQAEDVLTPLDADIDLERALGMSGEEGHADAGEGEGCICAH
jgi:hypothetical protein